jgi:3-hydroxymyristoyl/3-hydroxydecanoyl-(acyl carrier protein) dehydratase
MEDKLYHFPDFKLQLRPDHPAFNGHFSGAPIVPGVVILDNIFRYIEEESQGDLSADGLEFVKFRSPLLPNQILKLQFSFLSFHRIQFLGKVRDTTVVTGVLLLRSS